MPYAICNFTKPDGSPCGSPALSGKKLCYYHRRHTQRQERIDTAIRRADVLGPRLPPVRSCRHILAALNQVWTALLEDRVSEDHAGRVLFSLQQASAAIRAKDSARR